MRLQSPGGVLEVSSKTVWYGIRDNDEIEVDFRIGLVVSVQICNLLLNL